MGLFTRPQSWPFLVVQSVQTQKPIMAYSWDNRVKFVVRFMYDIDNNGFLDKNDFECLAVRNTIIESKGKWDDAKFAKQGGHGQPLERDRRARRLQQGRRGLSRGV